MTTLGTTVTASIISRALSSRVTRLLPASSTLRLLRLLGLLMLTSAKVLVTSMSRHSVDLHRVLSAVSRTCSAQHLGLLLHSFSLTNKLLRLVEVEHQVQL